MTHPTCTQCHNTTFHFDRIKHAIVCDVCGWEQNSQNKAAQMLEYDQYRQKAIAFVKARDYESAKPYLEKMRVITPDDPDIYYLHLMGLTDCCQNYLVKPIDIHTYDLVENYWSIFRSLKGDLRLFLPYFKKRAELVRIIYKKSISKALFIVILCYAALLTFLSLAFSGVYWSTIPVIITTIIILYVKPLTALFKKLHNKYF